MSARVIGYARLSADEQGASGLGLEAQRAAILGEANRRGWDVEWREDVASGKDINPGLVDVLAMLAELEASALVVAKMDRIARSARHAYNVMDAASSQGWALVVVNMNLDMTTVAGRAMAQMVAVFAEFERGLISERTRAAWLRGRRAVCRLAGHVSRRLTWSAGS